MRLYKLPIYTIAIATLLTTPVMSEEWRRIKEASDFNKTVVDKKLTSEEGIVTIASNGKVIGSFSGKALTGTWKWKNGYYCRKIKWGTKKLPNDCIHVSTNGKKIHFKRKKGKGKVSSPYTIGK